MNMENSIYGNMWLRGEVLETSSGEFGRYLVMRYTKNRASVFIKDITYGVQKPKTVQRKILRTATGEPYVKIGSRVIERRPGYI